MILQMLLTGRMIRSREFVKPGMGWDFRKAISRLRRKGYDIHSEIFPGERDATYWIPLELGEQQRLL